MNLPAHGTASPDLSKASLSIKTTHQLVTWRTTAWRTSQHRLAHQPTPPGETGPDRLAVPAHRQALALFQRHCFSNAAWRSTPLPPGAIPVITCY